MIWLMTAWAFIRRWWAAIVAVAGAVAIGLLKIRWTREGREAERADQRKRADEARDRMDRVPHPAPGETEDRLRKGDF